MCEGSYLQKANDCTNDFKSSLVIVWVINADDVICAHGATVGEIDDEQLFYLKSRGISEKKAKQILINAFLKDIINESVEEPIQKFVFEEAELALSAIISKEI